MCFDRTKIALLVFASCAFAQIAAAGPLPFSVIEAEKHTRAVAKKTEAHVTIIPTADQSLATQDDLVLTVKEAAEQLRETYGTDMVVVRLICQDAVNGHGEKLLAMAVYNPKERPAWSSVTAARRGYTTQELKYLSLWAELREAYQKNGSTDEDALDAAIHKKMKLKPGTVKYPHNADEPVAIK